MDFSALEIRRFFADKGLTDKDAQDFVRYFFGRHRAKAFKAVLDGSLRKERVLAQKREREGHIKTMWRRLRTDMRTRYHAARHRAKRFSDDPDSPEFIYYDALACVLGKGLDRIDIARARVTQGNTVTMTPTQWGASKGLPNNGLMWADWIKPEAKEVVEELALATMEGKHPKARPPRPFRVSPPDFLAAQRRRLFELLDIQEGNAKLRLQALEDKLGDTCPPDALSLEGREQTRRLLFVHAEIEAMQKAKRALDDWPRTRPLPVEPMHLLGTKMTTIEKLVEDIPPPELDKLVEMDPGTYAWQVTRLVNKAIARGEAGQQERLVKRREGDET